ncbi:2-iminobutanoate/2-iminopropanoate deaminase [Nocardioides zeae]|uniref:2-iminobutanoate/2-iminopropanoate deaminase n=2 Tax=Nocardioides zeae TaxID=1457234 RepID=A0ACC6IKC0_9ACTN|nr:RidA family protein [Nocardioides zeae]MDQ1106680.1 2-iminobutanoate/2-iminopropanoate deaminase [Nocardioides zeae]MDR6173657.1 2-iminobutanoate/2-iminopropanoate deaminase [Nocardioides zeae]MDR6211062.1 2-iminobutanoate/2-iminopropanoate deaminase [Nocardioides zeae]
MTASTPVGPALSPARWIGGQLHTSGLAAIGPGGVTHAHFHDQVEAVMGQLAQILDDHGLRMTDVASVSVYLASMDDFAAFDAAYRRFFSPPFPVRTTIACGLYPGLLFELSAIAQA